MINRISNVQFAQRKKSVAHSPKSQPSFGTIAYHQVKASPHKTPLSLKKQIEKLQYLTYRALSKDFKFDIDNPNLVEAENGDRLIFQPANAEKKIHESITYSFEQGNEEINFIKDDRHTADPNYELLKKVMRNLQRFGDLLKKD